MYILLSNNNANAKLKLNYSSETCNFSEDNDTTNILEPHITEQTNDEPKFRR